MILAIDYDMTIVDASGNVLPGAKEAINKLKAEGNYICIWSCRMDDSLDEAVQNLRDNGIEFNEVNQNFAGMPNDPRKIIADVYIDDKNILGIPSWDDIFNQLTTTEKSFKTRSMETIKHTFGEVRAFSPEVEKTRTIEFVISSNSKDRHRTVLPVDKWQLDNFNRNGIVGYMHNVYGGDMCNAPDPDDVIGSGRAWVENGQLIGSVTFEPVEINPKAEKIFRKVLAGTLKATSVGFNPLGEGRWGNGEEAERGTDPTYYFDAQELLEFSIVNIPSNPDALRRSMRDQASNAIGYIYRQLKGNYRFAEIESMTVRDVIDLLENKKTRSTVPEPVEGHSDQTIDQMNADAQRELELQAANLEQSNLDNDLILLSESKLALTAELL